MTYFAEPNNIEYDEWFDENIEPLDLMNYSNERNLVIQYMRSAIRFQLRI